MRCLEILILYQRYGFNRQILFVTRIVMYVSVSVKLDRSIKAEQAIGSVIRTDKKKRTLWLQPQSPAETFRLEMPQKQQIYHKAFL